ncbi:MAG: WG repeat-containing protein [Oscillospiraceae bacterium]|nr:WG repeat-containing protein [Oscillospiraceae bacterium]
MKNRVWAMLLAVVIPLQFQSAFAFSEGFARVRQNDVWRFIDKSGNFVFMESAPDGFANARCFKEGFAGVYRSTTWQFIDATSEM